MYALLRTLVTVIMYCVEKSCLEMNHTLGDPKFLVHVENETSLDNQLGLCVFVWKLEFILFAFQFVVQEETFIQSFYPMPSFCLHKEDAPVLVTWVGLNFDGKLCAYLHWGDNVLIESTSSTSCSVTGVCCLGGSNWIGADFRS